MQFLIFAFTSLLLKLDSFSWEVAFLRALDSVIWKWLKIGMGYKQKFKNIRPSVQLAPCCLLTACRSEWRGKGERGTSMRNNFSPPCNPPRVSPLNLLGAASGASCGRAFPSARTGSSPTFISCFFFCSQHFDRHFCCSAAGCVKTLLVSSLLIWASCRLVEQRGWTADPCPLSLCSVAL